MFKTKKHAPICIHNWEIIGITYLSPRNNFEVSGFVSDHYVRVGLEGQSTITQKCTVCNYVDTERHYGRVSVPGWS